MQDIILNKGAKHFFLILLTVARSAILK